MRTGTSPRWSPSMSSGKTPCLSERRREGTAGASDGRPGGAGGLSGLKLYGMVGLPTETDDDVEATAALLLDLRRRTPGLRLSLGVSTFVPKAHTPFQWDGVRPEAETRLQRLGKRLKPKGIELRPESYGWSLVQALLSRGDRRLAPLIVAIRGRQNSLSAWKQGLRRLREEPPAAGPPPPSWEAIVHGPWTPGQVLPWSHLHGPLPEATLIAHRQASLSPAA